MKDQQQDEDQHRGEEAELSPHDEVAPQVDTEALHALEDGVALAERCRGALPQRGGAGQREDHGGGQDEDGQRGVGDGRGHGADERQERAGGGEGGKGSRVGHDPELGECGPGLLDQRREAILVAGDPGHQLRHREGDDAGHGQHDDDQERDRDGQCQRVADAATLEGAHQWSGHQGQEEAEHDRHHQVGRLLEGQHADEHQHDRRQCDQGAAAQHGAHVGRARWVCATLRACCASGPFLGRHARHPFPSMAIIRRQSCTCRRLPGSR